MSAPFLSKANATWQFMDKTGFLLSFTVAKYFILTGTEVNLLDARLLSISETEMDWLVVYFVLFNFFYLNIFKEQGSW